MITAFIFIGPSGSGKGTQAQKLIAYLREKNNEEPCYIESGEEFRTFIQGEKYLEERSREIYKMGKRQPDFLAIFMWAGALIRKFQGEKAIIFDGTPRSLFEAQVLDSALRFLRVERTYVFSLSLSREVAVERLMARGRGDDDPYGIEKRLDWFEEDVVPAISYYKSHKKHTFVPLDAGKSVDEVWKDMHDSLIE